MKQLEIAIELSKGKKLLLFEDSIIDAEALLSMHPGGPKLIEESIGMEVSRFVYGGFGIKDKLAHVHGPDFFTKIKEYTIGTLSSPHIDRFFIKSDSLTSYQYWRLVSRTPLSPSQSVCKFVRPDLKTIAVLPYLDYYGKYFSLRSEYLSLARNYSISFSFSPTIYPHLMELVSAFIKREDHEVKYPDINKTYKDGIELIIKKGPTVSKFVHELPLDNIFNDQDKRNEFVIRGPFGRGLELKSMEGGKIYAITLGVPVLFFADLASYILRKNIEKAGRVMKKTYRLFENENFDKLDTDNFKLVLFSSFHSKTAVIGKELFTIADQISKEFVFDNFEYYLRIGEEGVPRWNKAFFMEKLDSAVKHIFLCGPEEGVRAIYYILLSLGVDKGIITKL